MGKDGKKKKELGDKEIRRAFLERNKDFFKKNIFANEFGINSTNVVDFASFDFDKITEKATGGLSFGANSE